MRNRVWIPMCFMFVFNILSNIVHPVTPAFLQSLNVHDYMFGIAFACMSATTFLCSPFWGKLSDQVGRTKALGFGFIFYGLGQFAFSMAHTELQIALGRSISGIGAGATGAIFLAWITDMSLPDDRSKNIVLAGAMQTVISSFGYLVGGVLGDVIGIHPVFLIQVVGCIALGILVFFAPEAHPHGKLDFAEALHAANPKSVLSDCKTFLGGALRAFFIAVLLTNFASICFDQCYNYYLRDELGFATSYNGYIKAAIGILGLLANTFIGMRLSRRKNLSRSHFGIVLLCGILSGSVILAKNIPVFLVLSLSYYTVYAIETPIQQAILSKQDGDDGILFGVFQSFRAIGWISGALSAGFLYGAWSKLPFIIAAIVALCALFFIKPTEKEMAK